MPQEPWKKYEGKSGPWNKFSAPVSTSVDVPLEVPEDKKAKVVDFLLRQEQRGNLTPEEKSAVNRLRQSGQFPAPFGPGQTAMTGSAPGFIGSVVGGAISPVAGSALGYGAGEMVKDIATVANNPQSLQGSQYAQSIKGGMYPTSGPPKEMFTNAIGNVGVGLGIGAAGQGTAKAWEKIKAPFKGQVNVNTLNTGKQLGIANTPAELLHERSIPSQLWKAAERVSESTFTGAGIFRNLRENRKELVDRAIEDLLGKVSSQKDPAVVQGLLTDAIEGGHQTFRKQAQMAYRELDKLAKDIPGVETKVVKPSSLVDEFGKPMLYEESKVVPRAVDTKSVRTFAKSILDRIPEKYRVAQGKAGTEVSQLVNELENLSGLEGKISFEEADFYRSQLLAQVRADKTPLGSRVKGAASKAAQLFDTSMSQAAKNGSPGFWEKYQQVGKWYGETKQLFNDKIITALSERTPEQVSRIAFASPKTVSMVRSALQKSGKPELWNNIARNKIEQIVASATQIPEEGAEYLIGKRLLENWAKMPQAVKNSAFDKETQGAVSKLFNYISHTPTKETPLGLWGMGQVFGAGAGLAGGLIAGGLSGRGDVGAGTAGITAGVILLGPAAIAKLATSKFGRRLLTEGYKVSPFTKEAIKLSFKTAAFLDENNPDQSYTRQVLGLEQ